MPLTQGDIEKIGRFVKKEPRTVQDIARHIGRSWVTAEKYVRQMADETGMVSLKVFREGTKGALKLVYYNYKESLLADDIREDLYDEIKRGRKKEDFDFFEIFQFIPDEHKKAYFGGGERGVTTHENLSLMMREAQRTLLCYSGNLSFIHAEDEDVPKLFEELIRRKVRIKILCRLNIYSMRSLAMIEPLLRKHPEFIEVRHSSHPLRGFIIDDDLARFKNEEALKDYRKGELQDDVRIYYEIFDREWIGWLQRVFWNLFRTSVYYQDRIKQLEHILH